MAEQTKVEYQAQVSVDFPNNTNELITALIQRTDRNNLSDSVLFKSDDSTVSGNYTFNNPVVAATVPSIGDHLVNKTYADSLLAANDAMTFKGEIDCSSNPDYPGASAGDTYKCSVAGKIGGASGITVTAGDTFYCISDNTLTGDHAAVGSNWSVVQTNIDFTSMPASIFTTSITGSYLTANELLITDGSKGVVSAPVATYPSLTELTYLKGVTSNIQTQLDGNVVKVGTPVDNQVAVWTGDGTQEGNNNLSWNGSALTIGDGTAGANVILDGSTIGSINTGKTDSAVSVSGGNGTGNGANMVVYGSTHATLANVTKFKIGSTDQLIVDASGNRDYQGNALSGITDITGQAGLLTIGSSTGVDLQYNGITELSVESGMVEVQNDLGVLGDIELTGAINNVKGSNSIDATNPAFVQMIASADIGNSESYLCTVFSANTNIYQIAMVMTNTSGAISVVELANSGSSILTFVDNSGDLAIQKTTTATSIAKYSVVKLK